MSPGGARGPLDGQVALVTGAGTGVGRGIAVALAAAGAAVVVAAHHRDSGALVEASIRDRGGEALCVECDVTDRAAVAAAVAAAVGGFGSLDIVVANAVSNRSNEAVELERPPEDLWEQHASVSLRGLLHCAQLAHPHLARRGGALLVLLSPAGIQGSERNAFYAAVKGAQRGFVKSLSREWGADDIRVNGLAPLAVTPALDKAFAQDPTMHDRLVSFIPSGRIGDPETDIGPAAAFLCGPGARYVLGQTLVVSGGRFTAL